MKRWMISLDKNITDWLKKNGHSFLRYSLAIIFIWFGALKPLGISPAAELVAKTVYIFDPLFFVPFLGLWEVAIGICLLYRPLTRIGLFLMLIQMIGTFLPILILPGVVFINFPYGLTIEGQYIIKNLALIGAGMVVGSHARDKD